ncbi:MAG: ABC transporter substrate-binding protein [Galactobacter sp.]
MFRNTKRGRLAVGAAVLASAALALSACGGGSSDDDAPAKVDKGAVDSALEKGGEITVWAWEPTLKDVVPAFEKKYPNVKVKLVNAGTNNDEYTALQNAVKAGKGVPDVAQLEYYALPQFSLSKSVADLTSYGAADLDGTFTPGPWSSVKEGNKINALPMDSGPMALFYNKTVFDKHNIEVPTTWDEYVEAGEKLHKADPKAYITNDTGDAGMATSLIWQAGGQPYDVDGTDVSVDLTGDKGTETYAKTWQKLLDDDLVAPVSSWSDEWYKGLGDGSIATLAIGAWMPANLESGVAAAKGDWRVAPLPQWEEGDNASSENGGSSLAVTDASDKKELAYAFTKFATVDQGVDIRVDQGAFPATTATLEDDAFLGKESEYFGGQKINEVLAESAKNVRTGWKYLPFQVYANSVFNDTVGQAYSGKSTIEDGLKAWQDKSVSYGKDQGFNVK